MTGWSQEEENLPLRASPTVAGGLRAACLLSLPTSPEPILRLGDELGHVPSRMVLISNPSQEVDHIPLDLVCLGPERAWAAVRPYPDLRTLLWGPAAAQVLLPAPLPLQLLRLR
eukprot:CAMPEP_0117661112 /NCGR_PEP_ID=MMETSP0804-20121206/7367_1 /TAXON_ID=1074897 /ORGANISM="Tetraselmis astigmatica, Strain CCMP880" /LENGTH=113 /DNA_ID=CAMNT_0005467965 /DNA_START=460 /DNA_END=801 /DNA_ORIENTATION=-